MTDHASTIVSIATHKGACEALLSAARLLRKCGHREAAMLLIENVPNLVPAPEPLPKLPETWPFPANAPEALI